MTTQTWAVFYAGLLITLIILILLVIAYALIASGATSQDPEEQEK